MSDVVTCTCGLAGSIQIRDKIRDMPKAVRDELARKAAAAGQSMQADLLGELTELAERPSMAQIVRRAQGRASASGSTVVMDDAVTVVRAARDYPSTGCQ
jgi:antitoxin FitA